MKFLDVPLQCARCGEVPFSIVALVTFEPGRHSMYLYHVLGKVRLAVEPLSAVGALVVGVDRPVVITRLGASGKLDVAKDAAESHFHDVVSYGCLGFPKK